MAVAVVTGGASGFGLALAHRCAARGFDIALLDLDGERAEAEAATLAGAAGVATMAISGSVPRVWRVNAPSRAGVHAPATGPRGA